MANVLSARDEKAMLARQEYTYSQALDQLLTRCNPTDATTWTQQLGQVLADATYPGFRCANAERVCMALFVRQVIPRIGPYLCPVPDVVEGLFDMAGLPGSPRYRGLVQGFKLATYTIHLWSAWRVLLNRLPEIGNIHIGNVTSLLNARWLDDLEAMLDLILGDAVELGSVAKYKPVALLKLRLQRDTRLPNRLAVKLHQLCIRLDAARLS